MPAAKRTAADLFGDSDSESESFDLKKNDFHKKSLDDDGMGFNINKRFASTYERRKQHEDMSNLKAKFRRNDDDDDDSDEETEDEDAELLTASMDAQIMNTIKLIRNKDSSVYDSKKSFFAEEELKKVEEKWTEASKNKEFSSVNLAEQSTKDSAKDSIKLKDWHRKKLLDGSYLNEEDDNENPNNNENGLTFVEEQQRLKEEFKEGIKKELVENDEDDDFLTIRKDTGDVEDSTYKTFLLNSMSYEDGLATTKPSDKKEKFLMDYILNRGWIDRDMGMSNRSTFYDDNIVDDEKELQHKTLDKVDFDDEEEAVESQERFERKYNFRFEEDGATDIMTYSRDMPNSLRRKDTRRKEERERKNEAKKLKKQQEEEERRRYANLQRKEYEKRLEKIKRIGGFSDNIEIDEKLVLDGDFDADAYAKQIEAKFGDDYYNQKEKDWNPGMDDDIDIADIVGDNWEKEIEGTNSQKVLAVDDSYAPEPEYQGGEEVISSSNDGPRKLTKSEKKKMRKMGIPIPRDGMYHPEGEMYDREGNHIGKELEDFFKTPENLQASKTGSFRYRQVEPENFGLTSEEILLAPESLLNEFMGLKKIAPYRQDLKREKDKRYWKKSGQYKLKEFRKKLQEYLDNPDEWEEKQPKRRY